ncbi:protein FAM114A2 [Syngnathus typhle]|uniref:protein FAM114A2 n=1 Tax=Syngnathus typhle TaxID=161592 RepID=UPI002A6B6B2B|nr:protein FAM114A2 [Syngnathus typhle]XP_061155193.1 protein FAM114A2 [Syngnathus typhle]XP_061155194.1 protein FAM114A2 [Syngnathus typhle]XP_061155195.1 protein FAM114A2 [Syngnathus typhle]
MSDSEVSAPPEVRATRAPDGSPPTSPDVAPTRKARRRAELQAQAEETTAKVDEEPPKPRPSQSTVLQGGWGYWGGWGKSILSTATATATAVGQGLTQVIEKAETSLGIPSPAALSVRAQDDEKAEERRDGDESVRVGGEGATAAAAGGAMGMLSSLTDVVHNTGKTMISGGLDALEFIGKKTMDVIAEGDPGFKKTKGLMITNSTLSQLLREAKEREELQAEESSDPEKKAPPAHYGVLFDQYRGLAHLEALEMLSRESESKVKSVLTTLSGVELNKLRGELQLIKDAFSTMEFDDDDVDEKKDGDGSEFEAELARALEGLSVSTTAEKLSKACKDACGVMADLSRPAEDREDDDDERTELTVEEVNAAAIRSLAELTARSIELFHKLGQSLLLSNGDVEAAVLSQLTVVLCKEVSLLSKKFTACLTTAGSNEKGEVLNPLITGVFLEASNSASYIQDAFQLLMPIVEIGHIQRQADPLDS